MAINTQAFQSALKSLGDTAGASSVAKMGKNGDKAGLNSLLDAKVAQLEKSIKAVETFISSFDKFDNYLDESWKSEDSGSSSSSEQTSPSENMTEEERSAAATKAAETREANGQDQWRAPEGTPQGGQFIDMPHAAIAKVGSTGVADKIKGLLSGGKITEAQRAAEQHLRVMDQALTSLYSMTFSAKVATLTASGGTMTKTKWEGPLGFEGKFTGDNRYIVPMALDWSGVTFPQPFRWASEDIGAHDGARVIGTIAGIERLKDGTIWGWGTFDMKSELGKDAQRHVEEELTSGVSLDLDRISAEVSDAASLAAEIGNLADAVQDMNITTIRGARTRSATLVALPAFEGARIKAVEKWRHELEKSAPGKQAKKLSGKESMKLAFKKRVFHVRLDKRVTALALNAPAGVFVNIDAGGQWHATIPRKGNRWIDMPGAAIAKLYDLALETGADQKVIDDLEAEADNIYTKLEAGDVEGAQASVQEFVDGFAWEDFEGMGSDWDTDEDDSETKVDTATQSREALEAFLEVDPADFIEQAEAGSEKAVQVGGGPDLSEASPEEVEAFEALQKDGYHWEAIAEDDMSGWMLTDDNDSIAASFMEGEDGGLNIEDWVMDGIESGAYKGGVVGGAEPAAEAEPGDSSWYSQAGIDTMYDPEDWDADTQAAVKAKIDELKANAPEGYSFIEPDEDNPFGSWEGTSPEGEDVHVSPGPATSDFLEPDDSGLELWVHVGEGGEFQESPNWADVERVAKEGYGSEEGEDGDDSAGASGESGGSSLGSEEEAALKSIIGPSTADGAIDLPQIKDSDTTNKLRARVTNGLLTGKVEEAQAALKEWVESIDTEKLSEGWKKALQGRQAKSMQFIEADPKAVEAYLEENYLRPFAEGKGEIRGVIAPKAPGWEVEGSSLVHESGMRLDLTPGWADYGGWSIGGPEGWQDVFFKHHAGLYPVSGFDLKKPKILDRIASYAPVDGDGDGEVEEEAKDEELALKSESREDRASLVASGAKLAAPVKPPAAWFEDPQFKMGTPLTVTKEGRVFGHLALWGTCHAAFGGEAGNCVSVPTSETNYSLFHLGVVETAEGTEVPVGRLAMQTGHADDNFSSRRAIAHYENTGLAIADIHAGEDEFGIWISGALRPDATPAQIRALKASPLSGDWRHHAQTNNLELVMALAVNMPGFAVPRPQFMVASGAVRTLVAAGIVAPKQVSRRKVEAAKNGDQLALADIKYLKQLAARERANEAKILKQRALVASGVPNKIHALAAQLKGAVKPVEGKK